MPVGLARIDACRDEIGVIGGVGKFLGLEGDTITHAVKVALLADIGPVEEIAGVDLQTRFGGEHFEHAARGRLFNPGREFGLFRYAFVAREIGSAAWMERVCQYE